jgi:hypothetical protein
MCPHTPIYVSSGAAVDDTHTATYVPAYYYICVLVPLYMCPHTPTYVSSGAAVDDTAERLVCADVEEPRGIRSSSLRIHIK